MLIKHKLQKNLMKLKEKLQKLKEVSRVSYEHMQTLKNHFKLAIMSLYLLGRVGKQLIWGGEEKTLSPRF